MPENPEITVFSLHPGAIRTQMCIDAGVGDDVPLDDTLQLPAATMLHLASGKADWLNGRSVLKRVASRIKGSPCNSTGISNQGGISTR